MLLLLLLSIGVEGLDDEMYTESNGPDTLRIRVLAIRSGQHAAERSVHLAEIFEMFKQGFGAEPEFVDAVFFGAQPTVEECGWAKPVQVGSIGVLAAHREAWKHFVGCDSARCDQDDSFMCYAKKDRETRCPRSFHRSDEWAIVLEDDAVMPPAASENRTLMILEIARHINWARKHGAQLFYLGSCGMGPLERQNREMNWLCTHAYAVTHFGARTLIDNVKFTCDPSARGTKEPPKHRPVLDWQMRDLCRGCNRTRYLDPMAKLPCAGVHKMHPYMNQRPDQIKRTTKGLFLQHASPSLRHETFAISGDTMQTPAQKQAAARKGEKKKRSKEERRARRHKKKPGLRF